MSCSEFFLFFWSRVVDDLFFGRHPLTPISTSSRAPLRAFATLCADNTPMVRRAAAANMKDMMECCTPEVIETRLRILFLRFIEDDQVWG